MSRVPCTDNHLWSTSELDIDIEDASELQLVAICTKCGSRAVCSGDWESEADWNPDGGEEDVDDYLPPLDESEEETSTEDEEEDKGAVE